MCFVSSIYCDVFPLYQCVFRFVDVCVLCCILLMVDSHTHTHTQSETFTNSDVTNLEPPIIGTTVYFAHYLQNTYYLMLKEVKQDVVKEQYKIGTQTKITSFFKHGLNITKYVGYVKCF
jgi:hypothetical protein